MKKIFLIDAANYLFRSYFAIKKMSTRDGFSTNALFGFIRSVQKIIKDFSPDYLACVFDGPDNKRSRLELYEDYKIHRTGMPEDLFPQLEIAKEYCQHVGICTEEIDGVEADDVIGSIATWAENENIQVFICSSDKDLCQLVNSKTHLLQTHKNNLEVDVRQVFEIYGVYPHQIIDYLALIGDTSDNIPGVRGIGPKSAGKLLQEFGSLENIYQHIDNIQNEKLRQKLYDDKDNAFLSYQLAKINRKIPIVKELSHYHLRSPNVKELKKLYEKMEFRSLLRELSGDLVQENEALTYCMISTEKELKDLVGYLQNREIVSMDTETTSLRFMDAEIVGIGFSDRSRTGYYVPFNHQLPPKVILQHLRPLLESKTIKWIGHNLKYDMHILANVGIHLEPYFDTMIASYLINSDTHRHGLDELSMQFFSHQKISYKELTKKEKLSTSEVPLDQMTQYCCEDVDFTLRLHDIFSQKLQEEHLHDIFFAMEMPLINILLRMERKGIYLDTKKLAKIGKELGKKIDDLTQKIYNEAKETFNINSPKQLSAILFEKLAISPPGKKKTHGFSTGADVLIKLREKHPIIKYILEYRVLEKLRSTYVEALITEVNEKTQRIHTSFNQSVTATGRLSSHNPNLQNIPIRSEEGRKIRSCFLPEKSDWSFVSLDYSQFELRILAHMSGDPELIRAFSQDEDIHASVAAKIFDVPLEKVTSDMRSKAKAVNFGLMYGQGSFGLSQILGIELKVAKEFIEAYFKKYGRVQKFLESLKETARKNGFATTLFGRKRFLADINSKNGMLRSAAERLAVNTPIQGTQADLIKIAMINVCRNPHITSSFLLLQIHDELVFSIQDQAISEIAPLIQKEMEGVMKMSVPLKVDVSVGKNWGEC